MLHGSSAEVSFGAGIGEGLSDSEESDFRETFSTERFTEDGSHDEAPRLSMTTNAAGRQVLPPIRSRDFDALQRFSTEHERIRKCDAKPGVHPRAASVSSMPRPQTKSASSLHVVMSMPMMLRAA